MHGRGMDYCMSCNEMKVKVRKVTQLQHPPLEHGILGGTCVGGRVAQRCKVVHGFPLVACRVNSLFHSKTCIISNERPSIGSACEQMSAVVCRKHRELQTVMPKQVHLNHLIHSRALCSY